MLTLKFQFIQQNNGASRGTFIFTDGSRSKMVKKWEVLMQLSNRTSVSHRLVISSGNSVGVLLIGGKGLYCSWAMQVSHRLHFISKEENNFGYIFLINSICLMMILLVHLPACGSGF